MISREAIKHLMGLGHITVTPDPVKIGPNSIDLRLGDTLKMYHPRCNNRIRITDPVSGKDYNAIDPQNPPELIDVPKVKEAPKGMDPFLWNDPKYADAWLLVPGQFYLAHTHEETYCRGVIPHLDGRSTCGRLSIEAHKTAGVGDNGFRGRWTLEIEVTEPVLVRPLDRLFQIYFTPAWGAGLAHLIASQIPPPGQLPPVVKLNELDPTQVDFGMEADGHPLRTDPIFEVDDLYGDASGGHHYQGSQQVRGPSPLD